MDKFDKIWLEDRDGYFHEVGNDIKKLYDAGVFKDRKIAILGVWNNAVKIKKIFAALHLNIDYIADNNPQRQGITYLGIESCSVEKLVNIDNILIFVLNNIYWKNIKTQLDRLGFVEEVNYYVIFGGKALENKCRNKAVSDAESSWEHCKNSLRSAFEYYKNINKKYNNYPIWLVHQPSIGDLYIFSMFLPVFYNKKTVNDCNCVLIVTTNSMKKISTFYRV